MNNPPATDDTLRAALEALAERWDRRADEYVSRGRVNRAGVYGTLVGELRRAMREPDPAPVIVDHPPVNGHPCDCGACGWPCHGRTPRDEWHADPSCQHRPALALAEPRGSGERAHVEPCQHGMPDSRPCGYCSGEYYDPAIHGAVTRLTPPPADESTEGRCEVCEHPDHPWGECGNEAKGVAPLPNSIVIYRCICSAARKEGPRE